MQYKRIITLDTKDNPLSPGYLPLVCADQVIIIFVFKVFLHD